MARPYFDYDKAASAVVDARLIGYAAACRKHKISRRTLQRYLKALSVDTQMAQAVALKLDAVKAQLEPPTMPSATELLAELRWFFLKAARADFLTAEMVEALAAAYEKVGNADMGYRSLEVYLRYVNVQLRQLEHGPLPSPEAGEQRELKA
jgi:hypothetical protein